MEKSVEAQIKECKRIWSNKLLLSIVIAMVIGTLFTCICAYQGYWWFGELNKILRFAVVLATAIAATYGITFLVIIRYYAQKSHFEP